MSSLVLTFKDMYEEVLKFLGNYNSGSPSASDLSDAKFLVNRAYSRLCSSYDWSFLKPFGTLLLESGKWKYTLPADFSYMTGPWLTFDQGDAFRRTQELPADALLERRSSSVYASYPLYHAVVPTTYAKEVGTGWEIWIYPNPNSEYSMHYRYKMMPQKLEGDDDLPAGGPEISEPLLELSLAIAEADKDEAPGVHDSKVSLILADAVELDKRRKSHYLGNWGEERITGRTVPIEGTLTHFT